MYNRDKAINALLLVLNKRGRLDMITIFKTLYFADKSHLAQYGRSISNNQYIAMELGPVPSELYDLLKSIRMNAAHSHLSGVPVSSLLEVEGSMVSAKVPANTKCLSRSDIQCIEESIELCRNYDPLELSDLSHDSAWQKTERNRPIALEDMILAADGDLSTIEYVEEQEKLRKAIGGSAPLPDA